eukprot:CAMPEP_0197299384 /NCGR_PEP_ID=MMETSP0890-20130614/45932_1 /TAXON_ID=44058 ORGANISM="Aureoumbra lagunensis, Strain CCMP1510" /NCGR_SAMPLE_ID=MMETSP0890 /ASSEMBLY_ACC=CAM_ASM_000533 /LENGTH=281 /DNA_ID=CAMNT_0042777671 /DNA_START=231 /DNA_END=1076 /DNA_ORIENTATION=+
MTGANLQECHVKDMPKTKQWLLDELLPTLISCHGLIIYDALILHYNATFSAEHSAIASQPVHRDNCVKTYNIALNQNFSGGGTYFEAMNKVIRLKNIGDALVHPGEYRHAGAATTQGSRWLLVLFLTRKAFLPQDHSRAFHLRIHALLQKQQPADALLLCRCALSLDSTDAEILILTARAAIAIATQLCEAHHEQRDFFNTLALRYAKRAARLLPRSSAALNTYGQAKLMLSRTSQQAHEAASIFEKALDFGFLDSAQENALQVRLQVALRTAIYLDRRKI